MQIRRVLISGASGMIGSSVIRALEANSIHVIKLIRKDGPPNQNSVRWNPFSPDPVSDLTNLDGLDAAIHLSGANVAGKRWTGAYKREIVSSRVGTTHAISTLLARLISRPRVLVCASAVGIYGDRGDEILTEEAAPGLGFLAETCKSWEEATRPTEEAGIRVVHARFGIVLSPDGGALAKLVPLFRLGLGGKLGSGRQWMSWVSLNDSVRALQFALQEDGLSGPMNVVSSQPVTNAEFTRTLGRVLHRPTLATAPAFALRLAVGQMADEGLLSSTRAVPGKLLEAGFQFEEPELEPALRSALAR